MEVKVWVEGLQKTICGVTSKTTCQDIVYALAHATGKRGRFVLLERWGKSEKTVAPDSCLMSLLQQKGEFWHDVQFILRTTDGSSANHISKSPSPLPLQHNGGPPESPFQRASTSGNNQSGKFRKSLTPHGPDYVSPKIIKTKSSLSGVKRENDPALGLKENNLPTDLALAALSKTAIEVAVDKQKLQKSPVNQNSVIKAAPSVSGSLETPMMPDNSSLASDRLKSTSEIDTVKRKRIARREDLVTTIRQHDEQGKVLTADASYFDREIALWEEKTIAAAREAETLGNQINQYRSVETSVIMEIKELTKCNLDENLKETERSQKFIEVELDLIRSRFLNCEQDIIRTKNQARVLYDEIQVERDVQQNLWLQTKTELLEERERLLKELQDLTRIHDLENRRLEEMVLDETRLDSTLLAKTLELDSLQESLKRANLEGFIGSMTEKSELSGVSPDEQSDEISDIPSEPATTMDDHSLPVPPTRKTPYQRLIVLKRNTLHGQGMWV